MFLPTSPPMFHSVPVFLQAQSPSCQPCTLRGFVLNVFQRCVMPLYNNSHAANVRREGLQRPNNCCCLQFRRRPVLFLPMQTPRSICYNTFTCFMLLQWRGSESYMRPVAVKVKVFVRVRVSQNRILLQCFLQIFNSIQILWRPYPGCLL